MGSRLECIKEAYIGKAEDDIAAAYAALAARLLATTMGFHGEIAREFSTSVAKSLTGIISTAIRGGSAHEVRASIATGIMSVVEATGEAMKGEGWFKSIAGKMFLPYRIATAIYDWINPIIPCLIDPPEGPDIKPAQDVKSPLAIDLDGDGIATYALKNGVYFDIDSDGFAEKTAWLNAKDAFLAIDRNKNGIIDDASELFGDSDKAINGFEIKVIIDNRFNPKLIINDDLFVQSA